MQTIKYSTGFTLIELMIAIGVLSALTAIAIPAYTGYIEAAQNSTALANAETLAEFEENYFYDNETYLDGTYLPPGPNDLAALDWAPSGDKDRFNYTVVAGTCGSITSCYTITVTLIANPAITQTISRP